MPTFKALCTSMFVSLNSTLYKKDYFGKSEKKNCIPSQRVKCKVFRAELLFI